MLLSVSKWRRILRGKTETKSAPKTIFSGNGNGLKNFTFLSTREQKNVHTVYVKQDFVFSTLQIILLEYQVLMSHFAGNFTEAVRQVLRCPGLGRGAS